MNEKRYSRLMELGKIKYFDNLYFQIILPDHFFIFKTL